MLPHWLCVVICAVPLLAQNRQYKRVHQAALRKVLDGRVDRALEDLAALEHETPGDPETAFVSSLAHVRRDDLVAATGAAERALELGLDPVRYVAGPRSLTAPLLERLPATHDVRLVHGPLLGHVGATQARVWLRTAAASDVVVRVTARGAFFEAKAITTAATDYTACLRIEGLKPATDYRYHVSIDRVAVAEGIPFRTAPAIGQPQRLRLVFGGGSGFVPQHERVWTAIERFEPHLLLLLGDNVYSDDPTRRPMQRYCYYRRQSRPEWRALVRKTPTYAIWDDHDFGTNDCHGGPEIERPPWKRKVWEVFCQNWANPGYGGGVEQPGVWYRFQRGDIEFFLLDGRYYRTGPKTATPSMLGPVQKAWLKSVMTASTATFKVLCSPVPWDYRTKGDSSDTWNGFRDERTELFEFLDEENIDGVVLVSADRHRSDAWRIEREGTYDLYEFNSSRLTNQHVHPVRKAAIFSYNQTQSFGVITFDTMLDDPTVRYDVATIDGDVVHSLELRLSQLTK